MVKWSFRIFVDILIFANVNEFKVTKEVTRQPLDLICPTCGQKMEFKTGLKGFYFKCPNAECKQTKNFTYIGYK